MWSDAVEQYMSVVVQVWILVVVSSGSGVNATVQQWFRGELYTLVVVRFWMLLFSSGSGVDVTLQ